MCPSKALAHIVETRRCLQSRATRIERSVMGKEPTHRIKLGKISVAIWANETDDHEVWFNATISRSYKNGEAWKDTTSLRRDDLPIATKALDMAYAWMWRKQVQLKRAELNATSQVLNSAGR